MNEQLTPEEVKEILADLNQAKMKGKSKYRNQAQRVNGKWFQSKREARAYVKLVELERAGLIRDLKTQQPFKLIVNGVKVGLYRSDFTYLDVNANEKVVADAKGFKTEVYKLKKALMKALFNIDILEI